MVKQAFHLRQMKLSDMKALMEIKNDEHWNQTEEDWAFLINNYPEYCLVSTIDDYVVGTVTSTNFSNQVGWIGMMLVREPYRGQGISRNLMNSVIKRLKNDCDSIKLDATPAGEKVYNKLGFEKEYKVFRITNLDTKRTITNNPETFDEINPDVLDQIKIKDLKAFGADRGRLIDYLMDQQTGCHIFSGTSKNPDGYLLSRFGTNYTHIGPVVADSLRIAKELMECAYTRINGPVVIDIPADKTELIQWVENNGFKIQREFIRMYLGSNPFPGMTDQCFAIAGPEYG